jgi:hypothetical protein
MAGDADTWLSASHALLSSEYTPSRGVAAFLDHMYVGKVTKLNPKQK